MNLNLRDDLERKPTGFFRLKVYRHGKLIEETEEDNLIVVGSQATHARLLGGDVANRSITQFGVGTDPTAPAFGNAALTAPYLNALAAPSYPAANQVQFAFSLGSTEANGKAISEFGLFTAGGVLYARKVRTAPLNKDVDLSFSGTWTITF